MATLKKSYNDRIVPKLKQDLGLSNLMAVPKITKITLNMGVGEAIGDKKALEHAVEDLKKYQVRSLSLPKLVNPSLDLRFAKIGQLVVK